MIEIGLILGINLAGLIFAMGLWRWISARSAGGSAIGRLGAAVDRAASSFLGRANRLVVLVTVLLLVCSFGMYATIGAGLSAALWVVLAVLCGAIAVIGVAHVATRIAVTASPRTVSASRVSLDQSLAISARAGGAIGLAVDTASALCVAGLFALQYGLGGGFNAEADTSGPLAIKVAAALPGVLLGAAAAAMTIQSGSVIYHTASDIGADFGGEREAGLTHDDPRNPAVVADLVGDHLGTAAGRSVDLFVASTAAHVAALVTGTALWSLNRNLIPSPLGIAMLPLIIRAFGVIASTFGVLVVRTTDAAPAVGALWRGHATATIIAAAGAIGAARWLLGINHWLQFSAAAVIGMLAAVTAAHTARLRLRRGSAERRAVTDAARESDASMVAQGLAHGLSGAGVPLIVMGVAVTMAYQLGASTGLSEGGIFATMLALTSILSLAPYALQLGCVAAIADAASGVGSISQSQPDDATVRARQLNEAGFAANVVSRTYLILSGGLSAILVAMALPLVAGESVRDLAVQLGQPAVLWSAMLGAAGIMYWAARVIRTSNIGARDIAAEVRRQLGGFPVVDGIRAIPADFTPSYRACIDIAGKTAFHRVVPSVLVIVVIPGLLGFALKFALNDTHGVIARQGLSAFVIAAAGAGVIAALAADGARAAFATARRPSSETLTRNAGHSGDALADVIGNAAGPSTQLVFKVTAATALSVAPLLT